MSVQNPRITRCYLTRHGINDDGDLHGTITFAHDEIGEIKINIGQKEAELFMKALADILSVSASSMADHIKTSFSNNNQ